MKKLFIIAALLLLSGLPAHAQFSRIIGITGTQNNDTQDFYASSPFTIKAGVNCTWATVGTTHTFNCGGAGATISGTIANTQVAFGTGVNTIGGSANFTYSSANNTFTINKSPAQTTPFATFTNAATGTCKGLVCLQGTGVGDYDGFGGQDLLYFDTAGGDSLFAYHSQALSAVHYWTAYLNSINNIYTFIGTNDNVTWDGFVIDPANHRVRFGDGAAISTSLQTPFITSANADPADSGVLRVGNNEAAVCSEHNAAGTDDCITLNTSNIWTLGSLTASGALSAATYSTATNCADSAGAAACGSAAAGAFVVDAAATTVVVSTTAVTANSEIFVQYDSSLGTRLGITCNTTAALPAVTARTAATSFTVTVPVAPITNPACYSFFLVN